jgi:hypothetical protein
MRTGQPNASGEGRGNAVALFALGVTLVVGLCGAHSFAAEDDVVVVLVDDRAEVRRVVLDEAETHAARIYRHTGVKMVWRSTPGPAAALPEDPATPRDKFMVRLIILATFPGTPGGTSTFLMGAAPATALECGGVAYVFLDAIMGYANVHRLNSALVLGIAAAHEVGHVLLRRRGHSAEGVMRSSWKPDDWQRAAVGFLLFSRPEGETMRRAISACH